MICCGRYGRLYLVRGRSIMGKTLCSLISESIVVVVVASSIDDSSMPTLLAESSERYHAKLFKSREVNAIQRSVSRIYRNIDFSTVSRSVVV